MHLKPTGERAIASLRALARRVRNRLRPNPDSFLHKAIGVVHIGANNGQERDTYALHGLPVLWVEAIPDVFDELQTRIAVYPNQKALNYLVTDTDGKQTAFHISSNGGASSSIYDLAAHRLLWPEVTYTETTMLTSITFASLASKERLDLRNYDTLVMDTQGSELLVLQGAASVLGGFQYIRSEVADFEAYAGCCRFRDLDQFLRLHGFRLIAKRPFVSKAGVGSYYDVLYRRARIPPPA